MNFCQKNTWLTEHTALVLPIQTIKLLKPPIWDTQTVSSRVHFTNLGCNKSCGKMDEQGQTLVTCQAVPRLRCTQMYPGRFRQWAQICISGPPQLPSATTLREAHLRPERLAPFLVDGRAILEWKNEASEDAEHDVLELKRLVFDVLGAFGNLRHQPAEPTMAEEKHQGYICRRKEELGMRTLCLCLQANQQILGYLNLWTPSPTRKIVWIGMLSCLRW